MKRTVIAGVDGGSSSTKCIALETGSRRFATSRSGPSNILSAGPKKTLHSVHKALSGALDELGFERADAVVLCLSGARIAHDRLADLFAGSPLAKKILIKSDIDAAVTACLGYDGEGVVVIAGTGSVAVAVSGEHIARAGGWGHVFDDEGGAYSVSVEALRRVFESYDGRGTKTSLEKRAMLFFKVRSLEELAERGFEMKVESIARFARVVKLEAERGDRVARDVLLNAATSLSRGVMAAADKVGIKPHDVLNVYTVGGMFDTSAGVLLKSMREQLSRRYIKVEIKEPPYPPAVGALMLASKELNVELPKVFLRRLKNISFKQ